MAGAGMARQPGGQARSVGSRSGSSSAPRILTAPANSASQPHRRLRALGRPRDTHRPPTEPLTRLPVDHQADAEVVVREPHKVIGVEFGLEFGREANRVPHPDPKHDQRPRVSQDSGPDLRPELIEVLVGEEERHPVLPQLRERSHHRGRDEALALVDDDVEGAPVARTRQAMPHHFRDEERSEERRPHLPDLTFAEVHDERRTLLHRLREVDALTSPGEDRRKAGIRQQGAELVLERRHDDRPEAPAVALELVLPEAPHLRVRDVHEALALQPPIDQESRAGRERPLRRGAGEEEGVPE